MEFPKQSNEDTHNICQDENTELDLCISKYKNVEGAVFKQVIVNEESKIRGYVPINPKNNVLDGWFVKGELEGICI